MKLSVIESIGFVNFQLHIAKNVIETLGKEYKDIDLTYRIETDKDGDNLVIFNDKIVQKTFLEVIEVIIAITELK